MSIFDDDLDRSIERDFEREPGLHPRPRAVSAEQLRLRALSVGFRPSDAHPDDCRCAVCRMRAHRDRALAAARVADLDAELDAEGMGGRCYACGERAIGTRDRRPVGGQLERACARHADTIGGR